MALGNYTELKSALASWLHRDDLTSQIDDFIDLCEADYNRKLRIRAMEDSTSGTLSAANLALPSSYVQTRSFQITVSGVPKKLEPVAPEQVLGFDGTGEPYRYALLGENMIFGPNPDGSYSYTHYFYKSVTALSGSNTTNAILTNHPDIYLWGSLAAAAPHIGKDPRLPMFQSMYQQAIDAAQLADQRDRAGGQALRIRVG